MTSKFYVPERVLVIAAHCDDIEFGASGTIARWTAAGSHVTYCIVTDSSSGDNRPDSDLKALVTIREREQRESAAVVGVEDIRFLGYEDGVLEPTMELRRNLTRVVRDVRPNLVLTFDPETFVTSGGNYINHPDHQAVAIAATFAVFPSAGSRPIFPELLEEGYEPHDVDRLYYYLSNAPDIFIDISSTIEQKLAALRCHTSQLSEEVVQMVATWNAEAGEKIGGGYAENFRTVIFRRQQAEPTTLAEA